MAEDRMKLGLRVRETGSDARAAASPGRRRVDPRPSPAAFQPSERDDFTQPLDGRAADAIGFSTPIGGFATTAHPRTAADTTDAVFGPVRATVHEVVDRYQLTSSEPWEAWRSARGTQRLETSAQGLKFVVRDGLEEASYPVLGRGSNLDWVLVQDGPDTYKLEFDVALGEYRSNALPAVDIQQEGAAQRAAQALLERGEVALIGAPQASLLCLEDRAVEALLARGLVVQDGLGRLEGLWRRPSWGLGRNTDLDHNAWLEANACAAVLALRAPLRPGVLHDGFFVGEVATALHEVKQQPLVLLFGDVAEQGASSVRAQRPQVVQGPKGPQAQAVRYVLFTGITPRAEPAVPPAIGEPRTFARDGFDPSRLRWDGEGRAQLYATAVDARTGHRLFVKTQAQPVEHDAYWYFLGTRALTPSRDGLTLVDPNGLRIPHLVYSHRATVLVTPHLDPARFVSLDEFSLRQRSLPADLVDTSLTRLGHLLRNFRSPVCVPTWGDFELHLDTSSPTNIRVDLQTGDVVVVDLGLLTFPRREAPDPAEAIRAMLQELNLLRR